MAPPRLALRCCRESVAHCRRCASCSQRALRRGPRAACSGAQLPRFNMSFSNVSKGWSSSLPAVRPVKLLHWTRFERALLQKRTAFER